MITLRPSDSRGRGGASWLDSYHSFSFGEYHDPEHMGFGDLRVINEDWIAAGGGFPTHPHRDMEIITIVLEGELAHKDSLGTGSIIRPGDVQKMSAGSGILHSEFNASKTDPVHLLQIWVMPDKKGISPGYQQKAFAPKAREGMWQLIASPDGAQDSITVQQDVHLFLGAPKGEPLSYAIAPNRLVYVHVVRGDVQSGEHRLHAGDAMMLTDEKQFTAAGDAELLLFDLRP